MIANGGNNGWTLELEAPAAVASGFMEALEPLSLAVSSFETGDGGPWQVSAMFGEMPDHDALVAAIASAAASAGVKAPEFAVKTLAARDWLAENRASFQPLRAGRFFIHPTFYEDRPPAGVHAIALDAATAFGSGEHGTTRGCLLALDAIARRRRPRAVLDMGCGSGILAIAAAKAWRRPVLAVDVDAEAVRVTAGNAVRNGVANLVRAGAGNGFAAPPLRDRGRFDLIVANILANPLEKMAPALARALSPGGEAVLSGLLIHQEPQVLAAYRAQGIALTRRIHIDGWSTLMLRRRALIFGPKP